MSEWCEHNADPFGGRREYCEIEAAEPAGAAGVVVDMLDELIYESGPVSSDWYTLISDIGKQVLTRTFSYLEGDQKSWVWPLLENRLTVRHTQSKLYSRETYEVCSTWDVKQLGANTGFVTNYIINIFGGGAVQASIELPALGSAPEVRPMTNYDYEWLFGELAAFSDLHNAERNDNARVLD